MNEKDEGTTNEAESHGNQHKTNQGFKFPKSNNEKGETDDSNKRSDTGLFDHESEVNVFL